MLNKYRYHCGQFPIEFYEIMMTGADVEPFLQTQCTYDISKLSSNCFQLISFLDPQGRLETYVWLVKTSGTFSLLIPELLLERSLKRLNRFLVSEDVEYSHPLKKNFFFHLGPAARLRECRGLLFDEEASLTRDIGDEPEIPTAEIEHWRGLTGWPSFDGSDYRHEILNHLRLFDLSFVMNKGCYPGQETVSKIATRRGAAFSPVLVKTDQPFTAGEMINFERKIGTCSGCYEWEGAWYLACNLLRDFRVERMKISFHLNGMGGSGEVVYYPLISGDKTSKASELFVKGSASFREENLSLAEQFFRQAILIDTKFADAYEGLGVMLGRQERFQEALALMQKLSEVDPKSVLAHTNMSLYLMRLGRISEAEEQKSLATVKSFQSFGDEAKRNEMEETRKKKQAQEWAQRESMFRQVIEIDPEDTLANYGLGSIAVEKGEWASAKTYLERVLKADPNYSVAYLALGKALKGLGLIEEARVVWLEGIKVSAAKGDLMPANQMQQELNL